MLKAINVRKLYRGFYGIKDINLSFPTGQVVGLFGENGSGKTTLLRALAGLISLDIGNILFDSRDIHKETPTDIVYISEAYSFFPWYNAYKNGVVFDGLFPNFDFEKFKGLLKVLGIPQHTKAQNLSRGNKSKLEMALGYSKTARYILIDEPFLGNDMFTRHDFLKLMCSQLTDEQTLIISTHIIEEIDLLLDRIIIMRNGYVLRDESMDKIRERSNLYEIIRKDYQYSEDKFKSFLSPEKNID